MNKDTQLQNVIDKLYPYQKDVYEWLLRKPKALNYLDMRLGKTLITLAAVETHKEAPVLIVCPKFALYIWQQELRNWFGQSAIIYSGTPKQRKEQWKEFVLSGCKYLITNYALLKDFAGSTQRFASTTSKPSPGTPAATEGWKWGAFIADEIHMGGLLNHKSKTYKTVDKLTKDIPIIYLLTGTPVRQGCTDLYAPLHLIDRERFKSYWQFVNRYCTVIDDVFGKSIERNPSNIALFRSMLKHYMVRKVKSEVFRELPQKQRQAIPVDMSKEQQKVYDELTEDLIAMVPDSSEVIVVPGSLPLIVRQRQLLACPQELGLKGRGAAIDTIIEMSHEYLDDNKHIIVYTAFRKAIPILEKEFKQEYPDVHIYKIQGQMTAEEFRDSWMGFQNDKYKHKIMLCVIKSGAAFKASAASAGFFLGYEWDFNLNEQAEDRMFSPEDKEPIHVYYITHNGTIEDSVKEKLNSKKFSSDWVIGTEEQFKYLLAHKQKRK